MRSFRWWYQIQVAVRATHVGELLPHRDQIPLQYPERNMRPGLMQANSQNRVSEPHAHVLYASPTRLTQLKPTEETHLAIRRCPSRSPQVQCVCKSSCHFLPQPCVERSDFGQLPPKQLHRHPEVEGGRIGSSRVAVYVPLIDSPIARPISPRQQWRRSVAPLHRLREHQSQLLLPQCWQGQRRPYTTPSPLSWGRSLL